MATLDPNIDGDAFNELSDLRAEALEPEIGKIVTLKFPDNDTRSGVLLRVTSATVAIDTLKTENWVGYVDTVGGKNFNPENS